MGFPQQLMQFNKIFLFGILVIISALEIFRTIRSDPIEVKEHAIEGTELETIKSNPIEAIEAIESESIKPKPSNTSYTKPSNKVIKKRAFTDAQLVQMWNKYILPKKNSIEYKTKWQWLSNGTWYPRYHSKQFWSLAGGGGGDLSRIFLTKGAEIYDQKYNLAVNCANLLTVNSIGNPEISYITDNHTNITDLRYSGTGSEGDLYVLDLPFKEYDIVFLPQVMEHMYDPIQIVNNVAQHLKIGGYLFMNAPTYNIPHMEPVHFYHYQPEGFAMLCKLNGLDILEVDYYGNVNYIHALSTRRYWANIRYYINNKLEPFENEWMNVFQTWVLCQKNHHELTVDNN